MIIVQRSEQPQRLIHSYSRRFAPTITWRTARHEAGHALAAREAAPNLLIDARLFRDGVGLGHTRIRGHALVFRSSYLAELVVILAGPLAAHRPGAPFFDDGDQADADAVADLLDDFPWTPRVLLWERATMRARGFVSRRQTDIRRVAAVLMRRRVWRAPTSRCPRRDRRETRPCI